MSSTPTVRASSQRRRPAGATKASAAPAGDGVDNDCDGQVDDEDPNEGDACSVAGAQGPCAAGALACVDREMRCVALVEPQPETCNQRDDDCDGSVDEDNPGAGAKCQVGGAQGPCAEGIEVRTAAGLQCQQQVFAQPETCDGIDDNCQGTPDEGLGGAPCMVAGQKGVCALGAEECAGGVMGCAQVVQPGLELCNGLDDATTARPTKRTRAAVARAP
jgi:hypothetical protein